MAIGLSLIPVGINYLCGGSGTNDYGSMQNLFLGMVVLIVTLALKHFTNPKGILSTASILIGILVGYVVAIVMTMVLPHTGTAVLRMEHSFLYIFLGCQFPAGKRRFWSHFRVLQVLENWLR